MHWEIKISNFLQNQYLWCVFEVSYQDSLHLFRAKLLNHNVADEFGQVLIASVGNYEQTSS